MSEQDRLNGLHNLGGTLVVTRNGDTEYPIAKLLRPTSTEAFLDSGRLVQCVRACAGMDDPAKEIAELRETDMQKALAPILEHQRAHAQEIAAKDARIAQLEGVLKFLLARAEFMAKELRYTPDVPVPAIVNARKALDPTP